MRSDASDAASFLLQVVFPEELWISAGAPKEAWLSFQVFSNTSIALSLYLKDKTPTRLPEALFLRFIPFPNSDNPRWKMEKLGMPINPYSVLDGGAKHMHSISDHVQYSDQRQNFTISPLNSPLICFGEPTAFPIPTDQYPNWNQGVSFVLINNIWNTNYIMWYPFKEEDADMVFRYSLDWD